MHYQLDGASAKCVLPRVKRQTNGHVVVLYLQGLAFVVYRVRRINAGCGCVGDVVEVEESPSSFVGEGLRNAMAERHTAPPSPSASFAPKAIANARLSKLPRTSYC